MPPKALHTTSCCSSTTTELLSSIPFSSRRRASSYSCQGEGSRDQPIVLRAGFERQRVTRRQEGGTIPGAAEDAACQRGGRRVTGRREQLLVGEEGLGVATHRVQGDPEVRVAGRIARLQVDRPPALLDGAVEVAAHEEVAGQATADRGGER